MWKIRARTSGRARGRMKSWTGAAQDRHGPETLPGELLSATLESSNLTWSARASTGHNTLVQSTVDVVGMFHRPDASTFWQPGSRGQNNT